MNDNEWFVLGSKLLTHVQCGDTLRAVIEAIGQLAAVCLKLIRQTTRKCAAGHCVLKLPLVQAEAHSQVEVDSKKIAARARSQLSIVAVPLKPWSSAL